MLRLVRFGLGIRSRGSQIRNQKSEIGNGNGNGNGTARRKAASTLGSVTAFSACTRFPNPAGSITFVSVSTATTSMMRPSGSDGAASSPTFDRIARRSTSTIQMVSGCSFQRKTTADDTSPWVELGDPFLSHHGLDTDDIQGDKVREVLGSVLSNKDNVLETNIDFLPRSTLSTY